MATKRTALIWLIPLLSTSAAQILKTQPFESNGICKKMSCNNLEKLRLLDKCVVIVGDLQITLLERTVKKDFENMTFGNLREITGFLVFYRVKGLESIGQLFPNLARIRGDQVFSDYSLIVYDLPDLKEVGLYNLLKIDRGGVIVWGVPQACFVNTVNWEIIAPRSRHVLGPSDGTMHCTASCRCSNELETNYCWNIRKCQRYLEGPEAVACDAQCFGCRNTVRDHCLLCRHYTYQSRCVPRCPDNTIVLPVNKYCVTVEECEKLDGWAWNKTCVFKCPTDYARLNYTNGSTTCEPCKNCEKTCNNLFIQTTGSIQATEQCVYVNGSLKIHVRSVPGAMDELRSYLSRIQNVTDYIVIYGSITITSLDFLSSLRYIGGRNLYDGKYSLVVHDMQNLQMLFTPNVTKNLYVERGKFKFYRNPVLCISEIEELMTKFPEKPSESDLAKDTNGYSGGCAYTSVGLQIRVLNETSVLVMFPPINEPDVHYSVLYVRLPFGSDKMFVPETCSDSEWNAVNVPVEFGHDAYVELTSLHPASTYAICVETYEPWRKYLARSKIFNFSTPIGKPEPPFISELVASSSQVVVIRWVNHKVYQPHINRYELDVTLIDIEPNNIKARNHCHGDMFQEIDDIRHAVVMRPPSDYDEGCESMCGILSSSTAGALVEEYFDVCDVDELQCNVEEMNAPANSTIEGYVRTLFLNISGPKTDFQVGGLAPFRDYRFRLRACSNETCSRSARGVVRTLYSVYADIPTITHTGANEFGTISVSWKPPKITNGPILAYYLEVLPKIKVNEIAQIVPRAWCVPSTSKLSLVVNYIVTTKYLVRVCATTLASKRACGDWVSVVVSSEYISNNFIIGSIILSFLMFGSSSAIGWFCRTRRERTDDLPLVKNMSVTHQSEPPSVMTSDFVTLYSIPLSDSVLDS